MLGKKIKNIIEGKNLVHEYSRRDEEGNVSEIVRALDGVDINIKQGDFVAVLGANGSGKSTFAKHLNALLLPTEGTVLVDGSDTTDSSAIIKIRQNAGMVFQNPDNQIIASIVEEDVGFGPENIGVPTEKILERVEQSLKSVDMYKYRKASPNHLSGGQKQRVAIAGIMAMKPKCIILDEATAMLDPQGRKKVLETVHRLNREEGITIIMITHYMEEVTEADYIYVLNSGKVTLEGTPKKVFSEGEVIKAAGLELPEITELAHRMNDKGYNIPKDILTEEEFISAVNACR